jgi:hypothetical protein
MTSSAAGLENFAAQNGQSEDAPTEPPSGREFRINKRQSSPFHAFPCITPLRYPVNRSLRGFNLILQSPPMGQLSFSPIFSSLKLCASCAGFDGYGPDSPPSLQ